MIEIRINRDPREYKDKVIAGLTLRQLICVMILIVINVPLYIFGNKYLGSNITGYLIMIVAVPLVLIGFFEYNSMPFEKVLAAMLRTQFLQPNKRKYANRNLIQILDEEILKEERMNGKKSKKNK